MTFSLDNLIEPEIKDDEFSAVIAQLASEHSIKTFLEIGSSTGDGSTKALVESIKNDLISIRWPFTASRLAFRDSSSY
jgi:predicted O-methyltransferase YrrM